MTEVQYHDTPQEHTMNTDKVTCDEPAKKLGSEYFFRAQRQGLGSAQQVSMEISVLQESSGMCHPLPGYKHVENRVFFDVLDSLLVSHHSEVVAVHL